MIGWRKISTLTSLALLLTWGLATWGLAARLPAAEPTPPAKNGPTESAPAGTPAVDPNLASRLQTLIKQLGSREYEQREKASEEIAEIGLAAREALTAAQHVASIEIRLRAERLLSEIHSRDFDNRLKAFAADVEGKEDHHLPGWEHYKEIAGSDANARALFVEMQREERWLLEASEKSIEEMAAAFRARYTQLAQSRRTVTIVGRSTQVRNRDVDTSSTAAMLLVATQPRATADLHALLYQFLNQNTFAKGLEQGKEQEPLRRLLGSWIAHESGNSQMAYQVLMLAMKFNMPEGIIRAERELAQPGLQGHVVQYALMTVAKLGKEKDLPIVTRRFEDRTICYTQRINNVTYQTQVRDVALAAAIHLLGEDPKTFGFTRIQQNSLMLYQPGTISFANEKDRLAAFDKWEQFLKERTEKARKDKEQAAEEAKDAADDAPKDAPSSKAEPEKPAADKPESDKPESEKEKPAATPEKDRVDAPPQDSPAPKENDEP